MSLIASRCFRTASPPEHGAQPNLTPHNYNIPSALQPDVRSIMGAEQRLTRSHDQIDTDIEPTDVKTEVGESSKRPRLGERCLLDPHGLNYTKRQDSLYRAAHTSATRKPTLYNHDSGPSASSFNFNRRRLLGPAGFPARQQERLPSPTFPTSLIKTSRLPNKSYPATPPRPSFSQLATDGQQGIRVLFFIDHSTKGDAIHHHIQNFVHSTSSEMKLLMSKYRIERSHVQNRFFAKARTICAQLTSRREFLEMEGLETSRGSRLAYFSEKCTKGHLSTLYSHIASAVDIPKILAARTANEKAFRNLMTQVFIHSMEDLWSFKFHPSKQDLPAKLDKEKKEELYNRFRDLTDRFNGLPAATNMPGYLEVPLKANFPRYVLFDQDPRPRNEEDICERDEEGGDGDEGGDIPHPWIPAEVRSKHNGFPLDAY